MSVVHYPIQKKNRIKPTTKFLYFPNDIIHRPDMHRTMKTVDVILVIIDQANRLQTLCINREGESKGDKDEDKNEETARGTQLMCKEKTN